MLRAEEAEEEDPSYSHGHLANVSRLWPSGIVEYKWYYTFPKRERRKVLMAMACAIFDTVAWLRVQFCWRHISTIKRS